MALLADVMAGQTRSRITDRESAYQRIAHLPDRKPRDGEEVQSIVPITFKALSLENVPLSKVIEYRKREIKDTTGDFTTLRHKYGEALEKQAAAMAKYPKGSSDRKLAEEEFEADMRRDCAALRTELGFAKKEAWQSKDFVTLALMGGTAAIAAFIPGMPMPEVAAVNAVVLPFVGVLGSTSKLAKSRRDLLAKHSMAYLYELKGSL